MRRLVSIVTAGAAAVALAGTVLAAQATQTAKTAKPAAMHTASAVGTIDKFDADSKTLTLTTSKGAMTFVLASNATVNLGSKALAPAQLGTHNGSKAKVHYTESNGQKTAVSVMVWSESATSTKKPASNQAAK
jgi:hypothetical protein